MSDDGEKKVTFQYYLVVFLDLLGQRETLRSIKTLPDTKEEGEVFLDKVKDSISKVQDVRKWFKAYFDAEQEHKVNTELVAPKDREEFLSTQKSNPQYSFFSDATIITVPLGSDDESCTAINGVSSALFAVCAVGLSALADGIVVRGGLDVGVALEIQDKEVYGPALERAYYLESQLAEYPRFVVGTELMKYLLSINDQKPTTRHGEFAKLKAAECLRMLVKDTDGRFMLDFLGKQVKKYSEGTIDKNLIIEVIRFVKSQHEQCQNKGNEKLAARYYRLMAYINSRKGLWGIE